MSPGRVFAALCIGALLLLSGCGDDNKGEPIPAARANQMIALIQRADQQSADGTCGGASAKVREAQGVADKLPRSVDSDVRQGLADGLERLLSLIQSQCERPAQTQTETTPTETETTQTQTTETETTPTETTQTATEPTQTETTQTETTPTTTTTTTTTGTTTTGTGGTAPGQAGGAVGEGN